MVLLALAILLVSMCKIACRDTWSSETKGNYIQQQWTVEDPDFIDANFEIYNIWSAPKDNSAYFYGNFYDSTMIGTGNKTILFNLIPYPYGSDWYENRELYFTGYVRGKAIWKYSFININSTISWFSPKIDITIDKIILKIGSYPNLYISIKSINNSLLCIVNFQTFSLSLCYLLNVRYIFSIVPISNTVALYLFKYVPKNSNFEYPVAMKTDFNNEFLKPTFSVIKVDSLKIENFIGDYIQNK